MFLMEREWNRGVGERRGDVRRLSVHEFGDRQVAAGLGLAARGLKYSPWGVSREVWLLYHLIMFFPELLCGQ